MLLAQDHQPLLGNNLSEVGTTDTVAYLGDCGRNLGIAGANGRLGDVDPPRAFAAELERYCYPVRFLGRFLFELDRAFRIEPLPRDGEVGQVDWSTQAGGGDGRVGRHGTLDRGLHRQ